MSIETHLIVITNLRGRYFIFSHFIDKKFEAQSSVRGLEFDPKLLRVHASSHHTMLLEELAYRNDVF